MLQLFSQGGSVDEAAACLGISKSTLYDWLNAPDKPEFVRVMQLGVQLSKAWWDRQGREGLTRKGFNAGLWEVNMGNRFGWLRRGEATEALPHRMQERGEVEAVRKTVDVAEIIRAAEGGERNAVNVFLPSPANRKNIPKKKKPPLPPGLR